MPGGDGTGPAGFGPLAGRGFGYCASFNAPGYAMGRGYGFGFRRLRRFCLPRRCGFYSPIFSQEAFSDVKEKEILEAEAGFLESQLKLIRKRLEELKEETE